MKKSRLLKFVLAVCGVSLLLVVCAYLVVTSSYFLRSFVVPRIGTAIGAEISAEDIDLSLLKSRVGIRSLKVSGGGAPFAEVADLDCVFNLPALLKGTVAIEKLAVGKATISIGKDAANNWTPQLATKKKTGTQDEAKSAGEKKPLRLDLNNISIEGLDLSIALDPKETPVQRFVELKNFSASTPSVKNGGSSALKLSGSVAMRLASDIVVEKSSFDGNLSVSLGDKLLPHAASGTVTVDKLAGTVIGANLKGRSLLLRAGVKEEGTRLVLENCSIRESCASGQTGSNMTVDGAITPAPFEAELDVQIDPLSPGLLNVLSALAAGISLGESADLRYKGHLECGIGRYSSKGELALQNVAPRKITRDADAESVTPFDLAMRHDVAFNTSTRLLELSSLNVTAIQKSTNAARQDASLSLQLGAPMKISLAKSGGIPAASEAGRVRLEASRFNLAQLAFLIPSDKGVDITSGVVDGVIDASLTGADKPLVAKGTLKVEGLDIASPFISGKGFALDATFATRLEALSVIHIDACESVLKANNSTIGSFSVKGNYNFLQKQAAFDRLEVMAVDLALLQAIFAPATVSDLTSTRIKGGTADAALSIQLDGGKLLRIEGDVAVAGVEAGAPSWSIRGLNAAAAFRSVVRESARLELETLKADISHEGAKAATLSAVGDFDFPSKKGGLRITELTVNESAATLIPETFASRRQTLTTIKSLSPCHLKTTAAASLDLGAKCVTAQSLNVALVRKGKTAFSIAMPEPSELRWGAPGLDLSRLSLHVDADSLDLTAANLFIPGKSGFAMNSGEASGSLNVLIGGQQTPPAITGKIELRNVSLTSGAATYSGLGATQEIDARISTAQGFALTPLKTKLAVDVNGARSAELAVDGEFNFGEKWGKGTLTVERITEKIFDCVSDASSKPQAIKTCEIKGQSTFSYDAKGDFQCAGAANAIGSLLLGADGGKEPTALKGNAQFDLAKRGAGYQIRTVKLDVDGKKETLANLSVSGHVFLPSEKRKSELLVSSSGIDLMALQNTLASPTASDPTSATAKTEPETRKEKPDAREPTPIDLAGLDLLLKLDLNRVTYGRGVVASVKSQVKAKDNVVSAAPMVVTINETPVDLEWMIDLGESGGWPFALRCSTIDLRLAPILKTFLAGSKEEPKGKLKALMLDAKGKGFTQGNLTDNLSGKLGIEIEELSLPASAKNIEVINLIYVPLSTVAEISPALPTTILPGPIPKAINLASNALKESQNLTFRTASIRAATKNGRIQLEKCQLLGAGEAIRKISMTGWFGYDGAIDLTTESLIGGLTIPLTIGGTIEKPKPDMKRLVPMLIKSNAENLLTPENVIETIADPKKGVNKMLDDLLGGTTTQGKDAGKSTTPTRQRQQSPQKSSPTDDAQK